MERWWAKKNRKLCRNIWENSTYTAEDSAHWRVDPRDGRDRAVAQHLEVELEELLAGAQFLNSSVRKRRRRIELSQLKQDVSLLPNISKPFVKEKKMVHLLSVASVSGNEWTKWMSDMLDFDEFASNNLKMNGREWREKRNRRTQDRNLISN